jgi:hypothetical protein
VRLRQKTKTLSPLLRSLAALALVVFVLAQAMCIVHCNFGSGHGDKAQPSCHGSPQHAASHDGEDDSAPSMPSPTTACSTLKVMLAGGDAPTLTAIQTHTLYLLPSVVLALDAAVPRPQAVFGRQAHSREWTFTPEVCLGPAFRSLAPPLIG